MLTEVFRVEDGAIEVCLSLEGWDVGFRSETSGNNQFLGMKGFFFTR
jgi:hypothetical protein